MVAEGESSVSEGRAEEVNVNIRCSNGSKFSVKTSLESTVTEFKGLLARNCDVSAEQQRLIYKGRILKDDQTLASYGLQSDHTVHMVRGFAAATTPASTAPASAGSIDGVAAGAQGSGGGPNTGGAGVTGAGASLFPGLDFGALGGTGAVFDLEQMQRQLNQNPNMMSDITNMPAIQNIMNNPEIMRSFIMNNPLMRTIIDRNPELGHILNDPSILRQTLDAARNPELMREMMRNTDRAMSNIEASPEGFNMLRHMYENVQEPFLNATTMGSEAATNTGSNPFGALLGNQAGSQTRDGSNSSSAGPQMTTGTAVPNANPLPNPWNNTGGSPPNNATRTNPSGNATIPSITGLGGLGLPELERMGMPDPSTLGQLLQNPAMSQMVQSMISDPQYMDQIINVNPQLRSMLDTNPHLREMMQNPEIVRELMSPVTLQHMLALQQQLAQLDQQQSTQGGSQLGQIAGNQSNMGSNMLMNMFGGLGADVLTASNAPNVPPEELYATQLSQLQDMGFFDTQENIRALRATAGNVHAAVERLLSTNGNRITTFL